MPLFLLVACIDVMIAPVKDETPVGFDSGTTTTPTVPTDTDTATTPTDTDPTGTDTVTTPTDTDTTPTDTDTTPTDTDTTPTDTDTTPTDTDTTTTTSTPPAPAGICPSYPYTSWADPKSTTPELNVIGIYEAASGSGGPVPVLVTRNAPGVLVLTSYSSVDWQVDLPAVHGVTEIVLSHYEPATVTLVGAGSAPVTDAGWIGACAYEIPDRDPTSGCETPDLQRVTEAYTGLAWSSFQGCYASGEFEVN